MQMHPMVSLKKASIVLGVDKEELRGKLESGQLQGEKRRVGDKKKWFVYYGEMENQLEHQRLPELMQRTERLSVEDLAEFFEEPEEESLEESDPLAAASHAARFEAIEISDSTDLVTATHFDSGTLSGIIQSMSREFAYFLSQERRMNLELQEELKAKELLLRQLPDLEKRLRKETVQASEKDMEIEYLRAHIGALEDQVT